MARLVDLAARWAATVAGLAPGAPPDLVAAQGGRLLERWSEPHRGYHDVRHLAEVLEAVDVLRHHAARPALVEAAAWFHDAVYAGRPGEDERASAAVAVTVLGGLGAADDDVAAVERLVLLTAGHDPQDGDDDGAVLCDADLAILASAPDRYREYASAVRREYAHVPEDAFRAGRAAVLRDLLAHPRLYRTVTGAARWEERARANVTAEVAALER